MVMLHLEQPLLLTLGPVWLVFAFCPSGVNQIWKIEEVEPSVIQKAK